MLLNIVVSHLTLSLPCFDLLCRSASTGKPIAPPPAEATRAARFLRETPGLNKVVLGDFLGRGDQPNVDVLAAMVALFDFGRLTVDEALRVFLEAFRLPGEAQQIDRIVQVRACDIVSACALESSHIVSIVNFKSTHFQYYRIFASPCLASRVFIE